MKKRTRRQVVPPVELIQRIQSLLPLEEAARTCILSKSWLHAWYTIPTLKLYRPEPFKLFSTDENETKYNNLIHTTLQRYHLDNIPIQSFHLQLSIVNNNNLNLSLKWIQSVVSKSSLKDLSLNIGVFNIDSVVTLPNELFSSQNLDTINVTAAYATTDFNNFRLRIPPAAINCVSLRLLDLECVIITQDVFHDLLSTCTLLDKIKLSCCEGLKNCKVKNLVHLRELDILSIEEDDLWEINNLPSLTSFSYRSLLGGWWKPRPFQMDSLPSVTRLRIHGVMIDKSFFDTVTSKFPLLESLTLGIGQWGHENMDITSLSLKWLTLDVTESGPVNIKVYAPRLLSFVYDGAHMIPGLIFSTIAPEQIKLTFSWREPMDGSFFLKMREALNSSSKFDINISHYNLDSVVPWNIDVDDLRRRIPSPPLTNVQLSLVTCLDERVWEHSRFFDAFFSICRPSYIRSSNLAIRKLMEGNTTDLKDIQLQNPHNGKPEALTSSWRSLLNKLTGHSDLECKLSWLPQ